MILGLSKGGNNMAGDLSKFIPCNYYGQFLVKRFAGNNYNGNEGGNMVSRHDLQRIYYEEWAKMNENDKDKYRQ
jgi:hypothetical protein